MTTAESTDRFGLVPAEAVIAQCLRVQATVPARSALTRVFGRSPLSSDSRPWYLGALGELRVAEQLATLGPDWTALHSVPIGDRGSDIDHVVLSPAGLFTVNTKFHEDARVWVGSKRLLVNGQKTDHLRNSRFEAERVARRLTQVVGIPVDVTPIIVIVDARSITIREQPDDVVVLRESELARWLRRRPVTIRDPDLTIIGQAVARRDTWLPTPAATAVLEMSGFEQLRREVGAARRVKLAWASAAFLAFLTAAASAGFTAFASLVG